MIYILSFFLNVLYHIDVDFRLSTTKGDTMRPTLIAGLSASHRIEIDPARTIDFLGETLRVYATPELVRDFETVCRELILAHTDPGEDSVGTGIAISHGGATLCGMHVDITVTVSKIEGRLVTFELRANDAIEEISRGSHSRFVVEIEKLRKKVAEKAAKSREAQG